MNVNKSLLLGINVLLTITVILPNSVWLFNTIRGLFDGYGLLIGELIIIFSILILYVVAALSMLSVLQLLKGKYSKLLMISVSMLIVTIFAAVPNSIGYLIAYGSDLQVGSYLLSVPRCWMLGCSVPGSPFYTFLAYLSGVQTILLLLNVFFVLRLRKTAPKG
jgi:hypothetical protein